MTVRNRAAVGLEALWVDAPLMADDDGASLRPRRTILCCSL